MSLPLSASPVLQGFDLSVVFVGLREILEFIVFKEGGAVYKFSSRGFRGSHGFLMPKSPRAKFW